MSLARQVAFVRRFSRGYDRLLADGTPFKESALRLANPNPNPNPNPHLDAELPAHVRVEAVLDRVVGASLGIR